MRKPYRLTFVFLISLCLLLLLGCGSKEGENFTNPETALAVSKLKYSPDLIERIEASFQLGSLADPETVDVLMEVLQNDEEAVQVNCILALGEIGNVKAFDLVISYFGKSDILNDAVFKASVKFAKKSDEALERLISIVRDESLGAELRTLAARALGLSKNKRALDALIEFLYSDVPGHYYAAAGIGRLGDPKGFDSLVWAIQSEDNMVRKMAAFGMGKLGDDRAVPYLINALEDANEKVRLQSARALGNYPLEGVVEALIPVLNDANTRVRISTIKSLGNLGDPKAVTALSKLLKDPDETICLRASRALGKIASPEAIGSLKTALGQNPSSRLQGAILSALNEIGTPAALDIINEYKAKMKDKKMEVEGKTIFLEEEESEDEF